MTLYAKGLRQRQIALNLKPSNAIRRMSDQDIIDCYAECSRCRQRVVPDLEALITASTSHDAFVQACNSALAAHACPASTLN